MVSKYEMGKEKSPADRQGENRRLMIHASNKAACRGSQNRILQKYRRWREKKHREYIEGGYKTNTFWENLLYFTLIRKEPESDFDKTGFIIRSISIAVGCVIGQVLAKLLWN